LPTVRALAATLRVSPVTVATAYRQLRARGLVLGDGRRGTRVRSQAPAPAVRLPLSADARAVPDGTVDLAAGNPDPALLPPLEPVLRTMTATADLYGTMPVLPSLRALALEELAADGIAAGSLAVVHGALDAIERLLRERLAPGDRIAVEDPTLPALLDLIATSGFVAEPMAIDGEGPLPDAMAGALARRVRAVIVTPRAQNPTGAAISSSRAATLTGLLREWPDVLLIENDAASAIAGVPGVTLSAGATCWAHVRSVSKFLGPDLRVALVAGDALTMARVAARQAVGTRWVSHLLQQLTVALWSDPASGRRLARATDVYERRRIAALEALGARGIVATARSGFNIWIPVREETATVMALAQRGWAVAAGERFRLRSAPGIRVTTSALAPEAAQRFAADCAAVLRASPAASA
jgi:DNA-binding transcriptional MocR family regulator